MAFNMALTREKLRSEVPVAERFWKVKKKKKNAKEYI